MSIVESVLTVFTTVLTWLIESLGSASALFYVAETGLTFIGTVTVIGLAIAVVLLVLAWIRGLLRLQ